VRDYCDLVQNEIAAVAGALSHRHRISHIHWGGGSPTMLADSDMRRLDETIRMHFDVTGDAEIAVEIDPRGFDKTRATTLAGCGVTRASIGLQDCDPKVQRAINRIQPAEDLERTTGLLRERGITSLNLDMVYGLPYQTPDSFSRNLDLALSLQPQRIAIFGYAHVPSFKKHQALIPQSALPDVELRLRLARQAECTLCAAGYEAIGLDHFARPQDRLAIAARTGTLRRNFQGYTSDTATSLIGIGASAIGAMPQGYVQNAASVSEYRTRLGSGRLPVVKGIAITDEDRLRRHVIEQIMCYLRVDLGASCQAFGLEQDALDWALARMQSLEECGALLITGRVITIQRDHRPAARLACAVFDAYLQDGPARHAISA
jgi:oxygen-independent coproporphyrinogen-3 oxidase